MAKVSDPTFPSTHGRMAKNGGIVYRTRNGKQQSYTPKPNTNPPTKAQKKHRALFGKVTALVNAIMADPVQVTEWDSRRRAYNSSLPFDPAYKRFTTTRSFAHFVITEQLSAKASTRRVPIQKALPKGYKMIAKLFSELKTTELYEILRARVNRVELDGMDNRCMHLAVFHKGRVVAYARLRKEGRSSNWTVEHLFNLDPEIDLNPYLLQRAKDLMA